MLFDFTVSTINSNKVKCLTHLTMLAGPDSSKKCIKRIQYDPADLTKYSNVLKRACITGEPASGKTKFIRTIQYLRNAVLNNDIDITKLPIHYLRNSIEQCDGFSFSFFFTLPSEEVYEYGIGLTYSGDVTEWLYRQPHESNETCILERENDKIVSSSISLSPAQYQLLNYTLRSNNALMLSTLDKFNLPVIQDILNCFRNLHCVFNDTYVPVIYPLHTHSRDFIKFVNCNLNHLTGGFIKVTEGARITNSDHTTHLSYKHGILTNHQGIFIIKHDGLYPIMFMHEHKTSNKVDILSYADEANSIQYLIKRLIILHNLYRGSHQVWLVDDFDCGLHSLVFKFLYNRVLNFSNQLICTISDAHAFNRTDLNKDEIWLANRNLNGSLFLQALSDYKISDKTNLQLQQSYLVGRYGGLPYQSVFVHERE